MLKYLRKPLMHLHPDRVINDSADYNRRGCSCNSSKSHVSLTQHCPDLRDCSLPFHRIRYSRDAYFITRVRQQLWLEHRLLKRFKSEKGLVYYLFGAICV